VENIGNSSEMKVTSTNIDGVAHSNSSNLIKQIQSDYEKTRQQLDDISRTLAKKEQIISRYLNYETMISSGFSDLCLDKYKPSNALNKIGCVILGGPQLLQENSNPLHLEIRCLGRFEVKTENGQVERWQSVKAKNALQYLLIKPREPVLKDSIVEALWPECSSQAANNNLKAAIHVLRQILNSLFSDESISYLLCVQGSYYVNPDIDIWIDVEEFEKHFDRARKLDKDGRTSESIYEYEKAEALYQGDYLEDEPYAEWTLLRRESLKDKYLLVLDRLSEQAMYDGDYQSCMLYCQKILDKDQYREDIYRKLIHCFIKMGQKNRALRWLQICRHTIESDLGSTLDKETSVLFKLLANTESA